MNELIWTKEPPTVPGQYWVRDADKNDGWVELVTQDEIDRGFFNGEPFELFEFAGPLPKPKEREIPKWLPCPFCGSNQVQFSRPTNGHATHRFLCLKCDTEIRMDEDSDENAIALWNQRKEPTE